MRIVSTNAVPTLTQGVNVFIIFSRARTKEQAESRSAKRGGSVRG